MARLLEIAMTETKNVFSDMPPSVDELDELADRIDELRAANVAHHVELIERAAARGAKIIGLGELFTAPYFALTRHPLWLALAEDAETGKTVTTLRETARARGIAIIAPIYERDARGKRFNTAVVIDADGRVLGKMRKAHIPDGKNEQGEFHEPFYYGPSDDTLPAFPVFATAFARVGVMICYDRHFEGVVRSLALGGAELVVCPAVTFGEKSERMWQMEFDVDAARNNVFIAGSNRLGVEPPFSQRYFGKSLIVGPNGRVALDRSIEGLVLGSIDLDEVTRPDPSGWDLRRDRRPEIYRVR